jgi:hypothetical protein
MTQINEKISYIHILENFVFLGYLVLEVIHRINAIPINDVVHRKRHLDPKIYRSEEKQS